MRRACGVIAILSVSMLISVCCRAEWVCVSRVIDGDTFETSDGTTVRVLGIDTPETKHPRIRPEAGGAEAAQLAKFFLEGKYVWLDGTSRDKYGRRLSSVTMAGGKSYPDIVRRYGYDKSSNRIYARVGSDRQNASYFTTQAKASSSNHRTSINGSTWVNGYYRSNGKWVSGHWRNTSSSTVRLNPRSTSISVPKIPSYGNREVRVKGYYRKDGTYVMPHTRSKKKK